MIHAFAGFVVRKVLDQRRAQRLERVASGLQVLRFRERLGVFGDIRREHLHLVAFDCFHDGVRVLVEALDRIFRQIGLDHQIVIEH